MELSKSDFVRQLTVVAVDAAKKVNLDEKREHNLVHSVNKLAHVLYEAECVEYLHKVEDDSENSALLLFFKKPGSSEDTDYLFCVHVYSNKMNVYRTSVKSNMKAKSVGCHDVIKRLKKFLEVV